MLAHSPSHSLGTAGPSCVVCVLLSLLSSSCLSSEHGDGSRGMSVFERILRCLLVFARHKRELN